MVEIDSISRFVIKFMISSFDVGKNSTVFINVLLVMR